MGTVPEITDPGTRGKVADLVRLLGADAAQSILRVAMREHPRRRKLMFFSIVSDRLPGWSRHARLGAPNVQDRR